MTGFVPWFWDDLEVEAARVVPGSMDALIDDLEREKPAVVVDAGSIMMARPLRMYAKPLAWLEQSYCFDVRVGALDVYRRKPDGATCATPYPRPFEPVDWNGRVLPIPIPRTLDFDAARALPRGNYLKPVYFPDGPVPRGLEVIRDPKQEAKEAEAEAHGFYVPKLETDASAPAP